MIKKAGSEGIRIITKEKLEEMKHDAMKRRNFKEKARLDKMAQWITK